MKKRIMLAGAAGISLAIIFTASNNMYVNANKSEVLNSHGNIIMENTDADDVEIYSSDAVNLGKELDWLFAELPNNVQGEINNFAAEEESSESGAKRRDDIESKGVIDYGDSMIVIDSSDFTYLADEIDDLELSYKSNTFQALNEIGTYFNANGAYTHNEEEGTLTEEYSGNLSFDNLFEGILNSQSVEHLATQQARDDEKNLLYYASAVAAEGRDLTNTTKNSSSWPVYIRPITDKNLTAGTAAWVDGNLIIGNGADNKSFYNRGYNQGYVDGFAKSVNSARIAYTYHQHTGSPVSGGGCYGLGVAEYETCFHYFSSGTVKSVAEAPGAGMLNFTVECTHGAGTICGQVFKHTFNVVGDGAYGQGGAQTHCANYGMNAYTHSVETGSYQYELNCGMNEKTIISATIVFP